MGAGWYRGRGMNDDLPRTILFTAFEPSGDAHASGIISELRRRHPDIEVAAWGGPRMEAAGAVLMGLTAADGAMGLGGLSRAKMLFQERARIKEWLGSRRLLMHVGVDSPSANVRIAPVTTATGAPYVQFVAPQYWAWAPWRLKRFKKLASLVLCILPFEQAWFEQRGMAARYVGHPVVSQVLDTDLIAAERARITTPEGSPRIVILPGSRRSEIHLNMELLVEAYQTLERRHPGTVGVILAAKEDLVSLIHESLPAGLPDSLEVVTDNLQGWLDWADLALNASGTVSLDLARQQVPMVAAYKIGLVSYIGSKFILSMDDRLLPNIVAGRRIVPEFVPHLKGHTPIADAADRLLVDPEAMERTRRDLGAVIERFGLHDPAIESADAIDRLL